MNKILSISLVLLLLVGCSCPPQYGEVYSADSKTESDDGNINFTAPISDPETVVKIANAYSLEKFSEDFELYYLASLNYEYYSEGGMYPYGVWLAFYECVEVVSFGCHYSLYITNTNPPVVVYVAGK